MSGLFARVALGWRRSGSLKVVAAVSTTAPGQLNFSQASQSGLIALLEDI